MPAFRVARPRPTAGPLLPLDLSFAYPHIELMAPPTVASCIQHAEDTRLRI